MISATLLLLVSTFASTIASQCFQLKGTQTCVGFEDSYVALSSEFTDVKSFDAYMSRKNDTNPQYIAQFQNAFACPRYIGYGQRHHQATFCALLVEGSAAKCNQPVPTSLCVDTCKEAVIGLLNVFNSRSTCLHTDDDPRYATYEALRRQTMTAYDGLCKTLQSKSTAGSKCIDGSAIQGGNKCGFMTMVEARYYCQRSPRDKCCQNLGVITSGTNSGNGSNGGSTTTPGNNLSPNNGSNGNAANGGSSPTGGSNNSGAGASGNAGTGNPGAGASGNAGTGNSGNPTANGNTTGNSTTSGTDTSGNSTAGVAPGQPGNGTGLPQNPDGAPFPTPPAIMPLPSGLPGQEGGNSSTTGSTNATDPNLPAAPQEQQEQGFSEVFKKNQTVIIIASVLGAALIFFIAIAWAYRRRNRVGSDSGSLKGPRSSMSSSIRSGATGITPGSLVNSEGHVINENAVLVVRPYQPNLSDEISLKIGDTVKIIEPYDDGWAFGHNLTTNHKGTFPMACLNVRLSQDVSEDGKKIRLRISSLYNSKPNMA